jgi:hypothetical protein
MDTIDMLEVVYKMAEEWHHLDDRDLDDVNLPDIFMEDSALAEFREFITRYKSDE